MVKAPLALATTVAEPGLSGKRVQQMTTDGFLYPNAELERRGILDRKGFPESYDMELLIHFMNNVKNASGVLRAPKYSHQIYDIVPGEYELIDRPDILIVEGNQRAPAAKQAANLRQRLL